MISIVITSFNEPETIGLAIEAIVNQNIKEDYELIVSAPDFPTLEVAKKYQKKNKQIQLFQDPGKGKSFALNLLLKRIKGRIIILSDGDVSVSEGSINKMLDFFSDEKVGCISGRPVSIEDKNSMLGYWSHFLCDSAHCLRLERKNKNKFLECSGYFWAFRNNVIGSFPLDVAEDSIIPVIFFRKGFTINYSPESIVYVRYPKNITDFIKQKKRTIKSHEKISKYEKDPPRMKTFSNEFFGLFHIFNYASTLKQIGYILFLIPLRGYLWITAYKDFLLNKEYQDNWERIESSKK